jgi:hypothetical protein
MVYDNSRDRNFLQPKSMDNNYPKFNSIRPLPDYNAKFQERRRFKV